MSLFKNRVNHGLNELWAVAYRNFTPYQDRLQSTNRREYNTTSMLEVKKSDFKPDTLLLKRKK